MKFIQHLAWTIDLDNETPTIILGRPFDWGDDHWTHHSISVSTSDKPQQIMVTHLWVNSPLPLSSHTNTTWLSSLLLTPPDYRLSTHNEKWCGDTHLAPGDIWEEAWGERPPEHRDYIWQAS